MKKIKTFKDLISEIEKNIGQYPNIIDYHRINNEREQILDIEFDLVSEVIFGSSEGIFLNIYIKGSYDRNYTEQNTLIFTAKTLYEDDISFKTMSILGAEMVLAGRKIINNQADDYIRRGYYCKKSEKDKFGVICQTLEAAQNKKSKGYIWIKDLYSEKII